MTFQTPIRDRERGLRGPSGQGGKGDPGSPGEGYGDRAALAAAGNVATNGDDAYLTESGREGKFVFRSASQSAGVTSDPGQGVYIAKASDLTGAGGAWVRQFDGPVKLEWFGSTANAGLTATAIANANSYRTAAGVGILYDRPYTVPSSGGGVFLGPAPIYTTPEATFSGKVFLDDDVIVEGRLPVAYADETRHFNYTFGKNWNRPFEERERPIDGSAIDDRYLVEAIDLSASEFSRWPSTSSDTWTVETPAAATAESVTFNLTNDSNFHRVLVPLQGGMEVSGVITGANAAGFRGVVIQTTEGFEYYYAPDNFPGSFGRKLAGAEPVVTNPINWLGQPDHQSYQAQNSEWTVRAVQARRYAVLLNGTEIVPARRTEVAGEIIGAGFLVYGGATVTMKVEQVSRITRREQTGKAPMKLRLFGNSITAPGPHGNYEPWMKEALDSALGVKLLSLQNFAIAGANSLDIAGQIDARSSADQSNIDFCVAPEINDVQQGASIATTLGNIAGWVADSIAQGTQHRVIVTGYLWYSQILALGQGETTANYEKGAPHRAALRRYAAANGIAYFDLSQITGPMVAAYLSNPTATPAMLRDNIHEDPFLYRRVGEWMAKFALRVWSPPMTPKVIDAALPVHANYVWMRNGWTQTNARYSLTDEGFIQIDGAMTPGTKTDGTAIMVLPKAYRPTYDIEPIVFANDTATRNARLLIKADTGEVQIFDLDASATAIRVSVGFFTALARPSGSGGGLA